MPYINNTHCPPYRIMYRTYRLLPCQCHVIAMPMYACSTMWLVTTYNLFICTVRSEGCTVWQAVSVRFRKPVGYPSLLFVKSLHRLHASAGTACTVTEPHINWHCLLFTALHCITHTHTYIHTIDNVHIIIHVTYIKHSQHLVSVVHSVKERNAWDNSSEGLQVQSRDT